MPAKTNAFSIYSDEELMLFICNGQELAFDELYQRYSGRLFSYFTRMLNLNRLLAEDALQDLFMKIAEHPEKFDRSRSFKTWVFSIASNSCKNYYRHRQVEKQAGPELAEAPAIDERTFLLAASRLDGMVFMKTLEAALDELSPARKEAFILKYQEEKSISEIALIQNCPEGSVKSRIHYTLKVLEEKLKVFNPVN